MHGLTWAWDGGPCGGSPVAGSACQISYQLIDTASPRSSSTLKVRAITVVEIVERGSAEIGKVNAVTHRQPHHYLIRCEEPSFWPVRVGTCCVLSANILCCRSVSDERAVFYATAPT